MKIAKRLIPFLLLILVITLTGCAAGNKTDVEQVITSELDLLKNLDSETTQKYISYKELFPDATDNTELSAEVKEVFSLFFQNFDYKILDIDVDKENKTASANLTLSTMDANTLAKDFAAAMLKKEIQKAADANSENIQNNSLSLEERYLLLNHLLKTKEYETVQTDCTMELVNNGTTDENWEIKRTYSLENDLVGGLMTNLSDPDILSPEDTLAVYLKALKKMDLDEMSAYLGVESILNTSDSAKNSIASALVEQVHNNFNYKIKDSTINGYNATVVAEITTFDSDAVLTAYQQELDAYLASPDAVIDGSQKRYDHSLELLLNSIQANTATETIDVTFHLVNDGVSWKLNSDSNELGDAIFGTLTTTPLAEGDSQNNDSTAETTEDSTDTEDAQYSEDSSDAAASESSDYSEE